MASLRKMTGLWEIKKYKGPHTCVGGVLQYHPKMDSSMLASLILLMVKEDPKTSVPILISHIRSQLRYTPSYRKAWIAKQKALEKMHSRLRRHVCPNLISRLYRIGVLEYYPQLSNREAYGSAHTISIP
ncbi:hypothetical protein J1N35_010842 [Gossypium stocksii]|uniref:Uncharacterized protein n=1 Tax=Gossypium stocksii TaxID=47602 RepID=A0A9D3W176_9ROSI|nr:hypothetical protein J1N35_010842 [Gossypium stocksii]